MVSHKVHVLSLAIVLALNSLLNVKFTNIMLVFSSMLMTHNCTYQFSLIQQESYAKYMNIKDLKAWMN